MTGEVITLLINLVCKIPYAWEAPRIWMITQSVAKTRREKILLTDIPSLIKNSFLKIQLKIF